MRNGRDARQKSAESLHPSGPLRYNEGIRFCGICGSRMGLCGAILEKQPPWRTKDRAGAPPIPADQDVGNYYGSPSSRWSRDWCFRPGRC